MPTKLRSARWFEPDIDTDVAPEAAVGGPLAAVRTGDRVTLDVERRSLTLEIGDEDC